MQLEVSTQFERKGEGADSPLILVIEDHPAIRHVLTCILNLHGYRSVCTTNGQEALDWIEHALDTQLYPEVILLDLFMPVMDGTQFLANLRTRWRACVPFPATILFTVDQQDHGDLACTDTLQKPFHMSELLEKLRLATSGQHTRKLAGSSKEKGV
jgi:CheY-like chemotaxis protein